MHKRKNMAELFNRVCIQLIFLLSAALILLLGIRMAGKIITTAQAERIEIINEMVDSLGEAPKMRFQGKKLQSVTYKYLEAFVKAVAGFEFLPRNDFTVLPQIINSLPQQTEVISFVYQGRNLTIRTEQPYPQAVLDMAGDLQDKATGEQGFESVVYSYYIDKDNRCIAEITLIAHNYDEQDWKDELRKKLLPGK